eukprot:gene5988-6948_t
MRKLAFATRSRLAISGFLKAVIRPPGTTVLPEPISYPRPDLPEGCPEQLGNLLELFNFMWTTRKSARAKMKQLAATVPSTCRVVCLRSNRQTRQFLSSIGEVHCVKSSRKVQVQAKPLRD